MVNREVFRTLLNIYGDTFCGNITKDVFIPWETSMMEEFVQIINGF